MKLKEAILGQQTEALGTEIDQRTRWLVSHFYYRDTYRYADGSIGRVEISSQQLRDLLIFVAQGKDVALYETAEAARKI